MTNDPLLGRRLGQYVIDSLLGEGGMATVYKARQTSVDRDVAIKVIRADRVGTTGFTERFQREAKTIASLSHIHILKIFDYGSEENLAFIVMELLDGGSLNRLISNDNRLSLDNGARLLGQIGSALDYAHGQGIIHRDLKPENVLLDKFQNAFLTDFGIARLMNQQSNALTQTGAVMGTPSYMAPELWQGEPADARTDVYALGIMLYNMLTGQSPFMGDTPYRIMYLHMNEMPILASSINNDLPPAIDAVIMKSIAKRREDRYNSAGEMVNAFRQAVKITTGVSPAMGVTAEVQLQQRPNSASKTNIAYVPEGDPNATAPYLDGSLPKPATDAIRTLPRAASAPSPTRTGIIIGGIAGVLALVGVVLAVLTNNANTVATQSTAAAAFTLAVTQTNSAAQTATTGAIQTATDFAQLAIAELTNTAPTLDVRAATLDANQTATEFARLSNAELTNNAPTVTASATASATLTASPTQTPSPTVTPSPTLTATITVTPSPTIDIALVAQQTLAPILTGTAQAVAQQSTLAALTTKAAQEIQATESANLQATAQVQTRAAATLGQAATNNAVTATSAAIIALTKTAGAPTPTPTFTPTQTGPCPAPGFALPTRLAKGKEGKILPGESRPLNSNPARTADNPSSLRLATLPPGSVFRVVDGPVCGKEGILWWQASYRGLVGWIGEGQNTEYFVEPVS